MDTDFQVLAGCAVSLGGGILVGIERERHKRAGPTRAIGGVRTFAIASLGGALAQILNEPWMMAVGALFIAAMAAVAYLRDRSDDPGVTTELALFLTYQLGVLAPLNPQLASGGFVLAAVLLASKTRLHHFATKTLTENELRDVLLLAAAALIIYPLVPNHSFSALGNANPQHLWRLIVLLMAMQALGYVAMRAIGPRWGLPISGLASGVVSSTATFAALGARSREEPALSQPFATSALCSHLSSMSLLVPVALAIDPHALALATPSLGVLLAGCAVAAAGAMIISGKDTPPATKGSAEEAHVFSVRQAVMFSLLLTGLTAVVGVLTRHFGAGAAVLGAGLAAAADMHAAGGVLFSLSAGAAIGPADLSMALAWAATSNAVVKAGIAFAAGTRSYARHVLAGLMLPVAAVWGVALLWGRLGA